MIVDTSAVIAIVREEPNWERLLHAARTANRVRMSASTYVETFVVAERGRAPARTVDRLLDSLGVEYEAFTESQARLARQAYRDYGKGSGHPARLNLGDCYAYALAIESNEPLLFVGDDFTHTDVRRAI